jgi:hypothetical protein
MHLARAAAAAAGAAVGAVGIAAGRIRVHAEGDGRGRLSPEALNQPNGVQQSLHGWQHVVTTSGTDASGEHSVRDVVQHCA